MKKILSIMIIAAFLVSLTIAGIGCEAASGTSTETSAAKAEETTATADAQQETTTSAEEKTETESFDWKKYAGTSISLIGCAGVYNEDIQESIKSFEELTGIKVEKCDFFGESDFYNKVQTISASKSGEYDITMVGYPNLIDWVPGGWLEPLDAYLADPNLTNPDYDFEDFYPSLIETAKWDGQSGHKFGTREGSKLWMIPLACGPTMLQYRKDLFDKYNLKAPTTVQEAIDAGLVIQKNEPGMYGIAVRGAKEVAMLYGGVWATLKSYGANDFDENLNPQFNSPDMVRGLTAWKDMITQIGDIKNWSNRKWDNDMSDFASGKCAMMLEHGALGGFINQGEEDVPAKGNIAWAPPLVEKDPSKMASLQWSWSLAISSYSKNKEAAWYFIQYVTGKKMMTEGTISVYPVRKSVFESKPYQDAFASYIDFFDAWNKTIPYTSFPFTPAIGFNDYGFQLAGEIQNAVLGTKTPQKAMDDLVNYYNENF